MKLGVAISILIIVAFVTALIALNQTPDPSPPTDATRAAHLQRASLPADLPALHSSLDQSPPSTTGQGDTESIYHAVISHWRTHEAALSQNASQRDDAPVRRLRELMIEATHTPRANEGFLDQYLPIAPAAKPQFGAALEWIQAIMLDEAERSLDENDPAAAREAALAVWMLGQRAFEQNVRLFNRRQGLALMQTAGAFLLEHAEPLEMDRDALQQWAAALRAVQAAWQPKLEVLLSVDPHAGDLIRLAEHDEDRTFRIAAALHLGLAKYTADTEADRAAAQRAIDALADADDSTIAEAASAADALTRRELRRIH